MNSPACAASPFAADLVWDSATACKSPMGDLGLVISETVTPGWSPDGASFKYEELRLRNEIRVEHDAGTALLVLDNLLIRPPLGDVTGMGFMEGYSHLGSLVVVDARVDQALADELH